MHKRLYLFLEKQQTIYNLRFGFRINCSAEHALISTTVKICEGFDCEKCECGVFIDLKIWLFDTVNHSTLIKKLPHYEIPGTAYEWFSSYLNNRKQFITIQSTESNEMIIDYGVPQGSVLGPLLFLIFINDLHKAIKYSLLHHYADHTNLLLADKSIKKINKHINHDLKLLTEWLKANQILNTDKTEIVIFRPKHKIIKKHLNFWISGQKVNPTTTVKYLGIILQDDLHWDKHLNTIIKKIR